jgi:hypothetical protein
MIVAASPQKSGPHELVRYEAAEERFARLEWIREARATFAPGERKPCDVCGKYRALSQAHHIVPLTQQRDDKPNQEFVWLCPTHHAAVHLLISQSLSRRGRAGRWQIEMIDEMDDDEFAKISSIFERFRSRA